MKALILITTLVFSALSFSQDENNTDRGSYFYGTDPKLGVKYFAYNSPNIDEYVHGLEKLENTFQKLINAGFKPKVTYLEIGIAPRRMRTGSIVEENQKIYVSQGTNKDSLERYLLKYFDTTIVKRNLKYFIHNRANLVEFHEGIQKIENVMKKFSDWGFVLKVKSLKIGIAPRRMRAGNIVEENGKVYISYLTSEDSLERYFMKYVKF